MSGDTDGDRNTTSPTAETQDPASPGKKGAAKPAVYLHGMPGGPAELELFGDDYGKAVFGLDRFRLRSLADRCGGMAEEIAARFPDGQVRLVAFSLGARPALEIARRLGTRVSSIDLIAPAAPIADEDRNMAGYPVFMLARRSPALFRLLTTVQARLSRLAPSLLLNALFKSLRGGDVALAADAEFRERMVAMLRRCFEDGGRTYRDEIACYVTPWSGLIRSTTQPVTLWHGTSDNWAPITMSERLSMQLPNATEIHRLDGLSHYSTLRVALKAIVGDDIKGGVNRA